MGDIGGGIRNARLSWLHSEFKAGLRYMRPSLKETVHGVSEVVQWVKGLLPSLTAQVRSPGPTWWKEITDPHKPPSDLHTCTAVLRLTHTKINKNIFKDANKLVKK